MNSINYFRLLSMLTLTIKWVVEGSNPQTCESYVNTHFSKILN